MFRHQIEVILKALPLFSVTHFEGGVVGSLGLQRQNYIELSVLVGS